MSTATMILKIGTFVTILLQAMAASGEVSDCFVDVAFVIDELVNIEDDNWVVVIDFIKNVVRHLNIGPTDSRVAAVKFGFFATVAFNLSRWSTLNEVLTAIDQIQYGGGGTNIAGGLRAARQLVFDPQFGDRPEAPNVLILLTDGEPTEEVDDTIPEANRSKAMGITIVAVGVTPWVSETLLKSIVTPPQEDNYLYVTEFNKLNSIIKKLANTSCRVTQMPLPSTTTTIDATGDGISDCILDVAFVIEEILGSNNWVVMVMIDFIKNVVRQLNVGPTFSKVAAVKFGDFATVEFNLSRWSTLDEVLTAIGQIQYKAGKINITGGLRSTRQFVFDPRYGDRPEVRNVLILLTDSEPNVEATGTIPESNKIKAMGIAIIIVGFARVMDEWHLRSIVTPPEGDNYLRVYEFNNLNPWITKLANSACRVRQQPSPSTTTETSTGLGLIVGVVVGCAVIILLALLIIVLMLRRRGIRKFPATELSPTHGKISTANGNQHTGPAGLRLPDESHENTGYSSFEPGDTMPDNTGSTRM